MKHLCLLLSLLLPSAAVWASCNALDADRFHCPSTGNAVADGLALWQLLNNQTFPCGATIVLDAGATYETNGVEPFRLRPQTGCAPAQYTQIISSRLEELPEGERVSLADLPKMPRLVANTAFGVIHFYGLKVNNWAFRGVAIMTGAQLKASGFYAPGLVNLSFDPTPSRIISDYPTDIDFDRVLVTSHEEATYGSIGDWYSTGAGRANPNTWETHFRTVAIGLILVGTNITVRNSAVKGITGFDPIPSASPVLPISAVNGGRPVTISGPGIASTLGITDGGAACSTGCNVSCYPTGCVGAVLRGATGSWSQLNGYKYLVYETANSVRVYEGRKVFPLTEPEPIDSTGLGPVTGNIEARRAYSINPQYAVLSTAGLLNSKFTNSLFEAWGMNILLGGGNWTATGGYATIRAGSTWNQLVLDNVAGLKEGDLIAFRAVGRSPSCPSPSAGCWGGGVRVGKVSSLVGTTVRLSLTAGPDAIDVNGAPVVNGYARWGGSGNTNLEFRRNTVLRNLFEPLDTAGKGPIEVKHCSRCLFDGNTMMDNPAGSYFLTSRNQGGDDPWVSGSHLRFSNNLVGGPAGSPSRLSLQGVDSEHTSAPTENAWFEHNLHPGIRFPDPNSGTSTLQPFDAAIGLEQSGWRHNTMISFPGTFPHLFYRGTETCTNISPNPDRYAYSPHAYIRDNISGFGEGSFYDTCWDNRTVDGIQGNVLIADGSASPSAISASHPGNTAVANAAMGANFQGTCAWATWEQCALAESSPLKGTATDGSDPGADIGQLKDRIRGWSDDAGLIAFDANVPVTTVNPAAVEIGAAQAILRFRLLASRTCSLQLFIDAGRTQLHPDTDSPAKQACDNVGNVSDGETQTIVLGLRSALTPQTPYYYRIQNGDRALVGSFTTKEPTSEDGAINVQVSDSSASFLVAEYASSPAFTGAVEIAATPFVNQRAVLTVPVPAGSVVYYRWKKQRLDHSVSAVGGTLVTTTP